MNLTHVKKLGEDDDYWHLSNSLSGETFKVAKKGLGEKTRGAIVQHFANGGEAQPARVLQLDPRTGEYVIPTPEGGIGVTPEHARRLLKMEGYVMAGQPPPEAPQDPSAGMEISQAPQKIEPLPGPSFGERLGSALQSAKAMMPSGISHQDLHGAADVIREAFNKLVNPIPPEGINIPLDQAAGMGLTMGPAQPKPRPRSRNPKIIEWSQTGEDPIPIRMAGGGTVPKAPFFPFATPGMPAPVEPPAPEGPSFWSQLMQAYTSNPTGQMGAAAPPPIVAQPPQMDGGFTPMPQAQPEAPPMQAQPETPPMMSMDAPGAPPSPQGPMPAVSRGTGGGGGYGGQLGKAYGEQRAANTEQARIAGDKAKADMVIQDAWAQKQAAIQAQWGQRFEQNLAEQEALKKKIEGGEIRADHWWGNANVGQRVAGTIGMILGGIGEAFGGGPNVAREMIDKAIAQDIDIQKANLGKRQNQLSTLMQQGHTLQQAEQLYTAQAMAAFQGQLQRSATQFAGPEAQARAQQLNGTLATDQVKVLQNFAMEGAKLDIARQGQAIDMLKAMLSAKVAGTKTVPGELVKDIAGYGGAHKLINQLGRDFDEKASGKAAGFAQYLPLTDASKYRSAKLVAAKAIGKQVEGGKMTDQDEAKYFAMLPDAWDAPGTKEFKLQKLREYVDLKKSEEVKTLGQAGYDVSGLSQRPAAAPAGLVTDQ